MPSSLHHLNKDKGLIVFSIFGCVCSECSVVNVTPIRKPLMCLRQAMPTFPSTSTFPGFIPYLSSVLPPSTQKVGFHQNLFYKRKSCQSSPTNALGSRCNFPQDLWWRERQSYPPVRVRPRIKRTLETLTPTLLWAEYPPIRYSLYSTESDQLGTILQ